MGLRNRNDRRQRVEPIAKCERSCQFAVDTAQFQQFIVKPMIARDVQEQHVQLSRRAAKIEIEAQRRRIAVETEAKFAVRRFDPANASAYTVSFESVAG